MSHLSSQKALKTYSCLFVSRNTDSLGHGSFFFFPACACLRLRACVQCSLRNDASNPGVILGSALPLTMGPEEKRTGSGQAG